ncbi:hypothetical protein GCM10009534_64980 [Kribbella sandramycini]
MDDVPAAWQPLVTEQVLTPPPLDIDSYRESLETCRSRFPDLQIRPGVEPSDSHWHREQTAGLLASADFNLVISTLLARVRPGGVRGRVPHCPAGAGAGRQDARGQHEPADRGGDPAMVVRRGRPDDHVRK